MLHQIGVGALGPVFRTYEPERDRLVAVKGFRLDITPEQARSLADELSRAAEAGLFHPSIVEPIAAGVENTLAYAAAEYVAAESLDVAMRHYAPAPIGTVLPFITQLAGAIDFARAAGVGHGALHPRDIFVTPEEARATGFGVVEALERVGIRAPVRRPYSPPERIAGEAWGTPADVFALAAITYELLTGRRPSGLGQEIGALTAGTPNAWMDSLHTVLAKAMAPEPDARYPTALAFAAALEAAARGEAADATLPISRPVAAAPLVAASDSPALDSSSTAPSARSTIAIKGPLPPEPPPAVADIRGDEEEEDEDDILAEQIEDERDHALRLREREEQDDLFRRDPGQPLDPDIEAEAEADRFVADDFVLDAAGAASAAPAAPRDLRARDLPLGPEASDTLLDPRALADDEVAVKDPPTPGFKPRDLVDDDTVRKARTEPDYRPLAVASPEMLTPEPGSGRSSSRTAVLLVAGIVLGLAGGYAMWGRAPQPDGAGDAAATSGTPTPGAKPAPSRDFSEQTVTPPAAASRTTPAPAATKPAAETEAPVAAKPPAAPATGTLVVRSTPSGAGVTVNGRWRGRTPLTLEGLAFRRYDVRVVQPGFAAVTEAVVLASDTPARSLTLQLQRQAARGAKPSPSRGSTAAAPRSEPGAAPPGEAAAPTVYTGSIYVDSRPRGARVSIDGKPVGVTPLRVPDVRIGTHVVRLELPDHRLWSTTTRVTAGQEQRVTGSLERIQ